LSNSRRKLISIRPGENNGRDKTRAHQICTLLDGCDKIQYEEIRKQMTIGHYSFGRITVDGKTYTSDVIIYPEKVDSSWWRKEGHNLEIADLAGVIAAKPDVLIIGTGAYGVMKVPEKTIYHLTSNGIEVHAEQTEKAVGLFNRLQKEKRVIAALHLTC
jgi:hypothetical protein